MAYLMTVSAHKVISARSIHGAGWMLESTNSFKCTIYYEILTIFHTRGKCPGFHNIFTVIFLTV